MLLPIEKCLEFFAALRNCPRRSMRPPTCCLREIRARLRYLTEVGLGYLNLDRQSRTLSGGEVQRINLTTALGTSLVNTLFVLDEPSIGLHPRDVGRIVAVMQRLRDAGNTLIVVEHDPKVMQAADRILDIGPGPGRTWRTRSCSTGPSAAWPAPRDRSLPITSSAESRVEILARPAPASARRWAASARGRVLRIEGAAEHNLKNIDVEIPLQRLVCVTGVSGSGKSTLVHDVLYPALLRAKGKPTENPGQHRALHGSRSDRSMWSWSIKAGSAAPPGPIPRATSAPSTPSAIYSPSCRWLVERKYTAGTFSFNAGNGRCPACGGNGFEHVEMQFLSDVYLRCPDCNGRRYRAEILDCRLSRGDGAPQSVADVLDLTVSEALHFFSNDAEVCLRLAPLADVGLAYLRLGQPVPTLSGGEAQRLKLAGHLAENAVREHASVRKERRAGAASVRGPGFDLPVRRTDHRPALR